MAKISIGMPVFNGEKHIDAALKSIQLQTFSDFQLYIFDNASTDRTSEICQAYSRSDGRILYFRNDENIGAAENFIKAFEASSSQYFMWAAADDVWSENWIACLLVSQSQETGISFGRVISIDGSGSPQGHNANNRNLSYINGVSARRLAYVMSPPTNGKANLIYSLWRRDILKEVLEVYRLRDEPAADMILCLEALKLSRMISIEGAFLFKRTQDCEKAGSSSLSFFEKLMSAANADIYVQLLKKCSFMEQVALIFFAPVILVVNSSASLINRYRFKK